MNETLFCLVTWLAYGLSKLRVRRLPIRLLEWLDRGSIQDPWVSYELGWLYADIGDHRQQLAHFLKARRLGYNKNGSTRVLRKFLMYAYTDVEQYESALGIIAELNSEEEPDVDILICEGVANMSTGNPEGAIEVLQRAVKLDPSDSDALGLMASAYRDIGEVDTGLKLALKAQRLAPRSRVRAELVADLREEQSDQTDAASGEFGGGATLNRARGTLPIYSICLK